MGVGGTFFGLLVRYGFEADDRGDERYHEEEPPEGSRLLEYQDSDQYGADCADTGPYGISGSNGECLGRFDEQDHTEAEGDQETCIPAIHFIADGFFGFSETEGEGDFAEAADD